MCTLPDWQDRLLFIGGLHRSGTSIVHRCLSEHQSISGFAGTGVPEDEGQHLQSVYPAAIAHGGPGKFGFDPAAHLTEASPLVSPGADQALFDAWAPHWDLSAKVLIEKSPPNLIRTRFLQALFPRARFIMMIRHPVAVSFATQKWSRTSLHSLLQRWCVCHNTLLTDLPYLRHALIVRYEDFVTAPKIVLARMLSFIGLEFGGVGQEVRSDVNAKYLEQFRKMNEQGLARKTYYRFLQHRYERRARTFGYSLRDRDYVLETPRLALQS